MPELRPWVSAVWWCQDATAAESVLPAGRAHLVLRPAGGWHAGVLHGPASRPRLAGPVPGEPVIGVVFRPGGLRPFFRAPAGTLADLSVPLPELWSRDESGLADPLADGPGPAGAPASAALLLDGVEGALVARADHASGDAAPLISDVQRGLRQGHSVARLAFADQPHLTREFRHFAGFTPGCLHRRPGPTPWHVAHDETFKTGKPDPCTLPS